MVRASGAGNWENMNDGLELNAAVVWGGTVAQRLGLSPHSNKVPGTIPGFGGAYLCEVCVLSLCPSRFITCAIGSPLGTGNKLDKTWVFYTLLLC